MPVHNIDTGLDYATIQDAINAPETLTGNTIRVDAGTYPENVVASKSITLIGADMASTIIDGGGADYTIHVMANNVEISGFTITNGGAPDDELPAGILLDSVNGCNITGNLVSGNPFFGIYILRSSDNSVTGNTITNNENAVQLDWGASSNTVSGNTITANGNGVAFSSGGSGNVISGNSITANSNHGVELYDTSDNIISDNNIANNGVGIYLFGSTTTGNSIYHNRFDNTVQVYTDAGITNNWDNGYPSGGNYWSDYAGADTKSGPNQDQPGSDGLGDIAYAINTINIDGYPLYDDFWNTVQFQVDINGQLTQIIIETNAAITDTSSTLNTLDFTAGGLSPFIGSIRAIIPHSDTANLQVTVDGDTVIPLIETDGTNDYVFFQFPFTTHPVEFLFGAGPSVFFNPPAINGKTVDINGGVTPGDKIIDNGIDWDWGDGTVEQHYFPNSHAYASDGTYTVTVTAHYQDASGTFVASGSVDVTTLGEGIKSGGWSLTIDNSRGGGSVSYHSSLGDGTVPSGGSVELYLADGDPVWGIGATPDTGYIFGLWAVSATNVPIQNGYDQTSNPVAILVYSDGTIMANFVPVHVVPANPYGPLLAIAACFAGFFIFKRQRFGLGRTQHLKRTLTATLYRNFS